VAKKIAVYLETSPKRTFAVAVDWPGWARGGKTADEALAALAEYASRYGRVARRARIAFPENIDDPSAFEVVERLKGGASTEFGVPAETPTVDRGKAGNVEVDRMTALLRAAWSTFDAVAKDAEGIELRKGPRGGGRDLAKMREHVVGAERSYLGMVGGESGKAAERLTIVEVRKSALDALTKRLRGDPAAAASGRRKLWEPRYFVRRSAWHSLDHAWEIEDRAETGGATAGRPAAGARG
jgi:hypothetical protein